MAPLTQNILGSWSLDSRARFGSEVQLHAHKLSQTGLFTDEALAALLDRYPREMVDVCTTAQDDNRFSGRLAIVDPGAASGAVLVEAARSGAVWINIREAMNSDPLYRPLLDQAYAELQERTGQIPRPRHRRAGILISSPAASVPLHCDPTHTLLWHVRGRKRIFVYPPNGGAMDAETYEAILQGQRDQDLPMTSETATPAHVIDLPEDTLACWPHTSPHRVVNSGFCVSMVMEFTTAGTRHRNDAAFFDGIMRRRFGHRPAASAKSGTVQLLKALAGSALRRMGTHRPYVRQDFVRFRIDPSQPSVLSPVPAYLRPQSAEARG